MIDPCLGTLIDLGGAALLAPAAAHKARRLREFGEARGAYSSVPDSWARRGAALIPLLEMALAAALLTPALHRVGAIAAAALIASYGGAIALNLARGRRDLDCGCAGPRARRRIAPWMVWRNLIGALALAAAAMPWSMRALTGVALLTIGGGLAAAILIYRAVDRLAGEIAPRSLAIRSAS